MTELVITGTVPSKKNLLKLTKGGRGYYDSATRQILNDLSSQVERQWGSRPPLVHPAIAVVFYVTTGRSDKDNKYTTLLDALVSGGVLKDDCIALCNGPVILCEAVMTPSIAGAKVLLEENGSLASLYRYVMSQDFTEYGWLKLARAARALPKAAFKGRSLRKL